MGTIDLPKRVDVQGTLDAIEKRLCESSLHEFIKRAWHVVEPGSPYIDNWHIPFITEHLEAITDGHVLDDGSPYNRLLINVPPGPGWVENPVMTDKGRVRLGDIRPGDMVLTHRGRYRNVSACYLKGELDTLIVKTRSGREMVLTHDHNVLTPDGWVEARHLTVGSTLATVTPEAGLANNLITPEEARFLGYLIGDGSITQATVSFTNYDADTVEDFERCAASLGFGTKRSNHGVVRVHGGKKVHDWLESHGLFRASSYEKHIPDAVLCSGNSIIKNFIGAYWSCDGMFDVRPTKTRGSSYRASATAVSRRLADDLLHALTRVGIRSVLRPKSRSLNTVAQPGGIYRSYNIEVYAEEDTARFIDMPGLSIRKNTLAKMCARRRFDSVLNEDLVVDILSGGVRECMCISVDEDHSLTWSDIAVHNTMKSMVINIFWPAWEWGPCNQPHHRYICAAHQQGLAIRDSTKMRRLVTSDWYQKHWGDRVKLTGDQNQKTKFENTATGFREAIAAGSITGSRGTRVLIDDAHSVESANSDAMRASTLEWFTEAVPTRLNSPKQSAIVVIMQRLHEEDVSGVILDRKGFKGTYDHICLPMRYEKWRDGIPTKLGYTDPRTEEGELLFPGRFPPEVVDDLEGKLGPYATAGQHQQAPTPRGGGIIKDSWWMPWDAPEFPELEFIVAGLDTAYSTAADTKGDYSALAIWGVFSGDPKARSTIGVDRYGKKFDNFVSTTYSDDLTGIPKVILMGAWAERLDIHELTNKVAADCKRFKVDKLLIENKAAGHSVAQEMRRLFAHEDFAVQMYDPKSIDKLGRLYSVQHLFSEGMIYAPDKEWAEALIRQVSTFPRGKHDDLVDVTSMPLRHLRDLGLLTRSPERIAEINEDKQYRGKPPAPLYGV